MAYEKPYLDLLATTDEIVLGGEELGTESEPPVGPRTSIQPDFTALGLD